MIGQLNNCSELIKFIIEELNDYKYDVVKFQGEAIEVTKTTLDYIDIGVIKGRCLITLSKSAEGAFDLHCIHGIIHFNKQYPCVVVPDYIKNELLDTLASYTIMEHTDEAISSVMSYGYTRKEAINILDGKNANGSKFIDFPF